MRDRRKKVMIVFGTRPEAIKMASVVKQFKSEEERFETIVCVTAQHREMLDQILQLFEITPQYDLDVMTDNQSLADLTSKVMVGMSKVMEKEKPNTVIVQGDTATTFVSSLAAYYLKIPVAHIEAGLRTKDKYSPFPEEINRRLASILADFHFAPTQEAKNNLLKEGIDETSIYLTGNTVIDALKWVIDKQNESSTGAKWQNFFRTQFGIEFSNKIRTILVTGHRREHFGNGFEKICFALSLIARNNSDIQIVYPVHLNPNVQKPVYSLLSDMKNIHLIPPIDYEPFLFLMKKSYIILTDSGGIQEEAPFLGKPVLVMRNTTERPEGVEAGTAKLIGTDSAKIVKETDILLHDSMEHHRMSKAINPYGNGTAAKHIINIISNSLV